MNSAIEAKPKVGDLYLSVSGSSVWVGEFSGGWHGSSTVILRARRFHNMLTKEYREAKDFTPRKALSSEWGLYLVNKYLPELAERSLWVRHGYEWNLLGRVGDGVEPAKKVKEHESAPREDWELVPGAILSSSWGYEQTNIDWYEVIKRKGDWVWVEKIGGHATETGWCRGTTLPNPEHRTGKILRRRVNAHNGKESGVRITSYAHASLWDGKPEHWSSYA